MHPTLRRAHLAIITLIVVLVACRSAATGDSASASATDAPATRSASVEATESAPPSVEPTASASDEPSASPGEPASGFTVLPNPEADSLFLDRDECENSEDGYRLEFPEAWYTNTEIGDVPACSWFSPTFYEADESGDVPPEIAITITYLTGDSGSFEEDISREEVMVGATQPAVRVEYRGAEGEGGMKPADWRQYVYLVQLGPTEEEGPNLLVQTNTDMGGDYELNKAVLDRIMATIEFIGTIQ
jgi:hypothetical protein